MYEEMSLSHMETGQGSVLFHNKAIHLLPAIMASLINRTLFLLSRGMSDMLPSKASLGEQGISNPVISSRISNIEPR